MGTSSCSSSSSSSCTSFGSFEDVTTVMTTAATVKLLCSYGGKIVPRYPDGKLRYVGGETRVLAVDRSILFSELQTKLGELCGWDSVSVGLRCQLPTEDLDALVSVTSDEDLANLLEEYPLAATASTAPSKIRAFMFPKISASSTMAKVKGKPFAGTPTNRCDILPPTRFSNRKGNIWQ